MLNTIQWQTDKGRVLRDARGSMSLGRGGNCNTGIVNCKPTTNIYDAVTCIVVQVAALEYREVGEGCDKRQLRHTGAAPG
jgi:hypothetical protein